MNKYHAIKTVVDGITFASKREAARYQELRLLENAGEINNLVCHPRYMVAEGQRDMHLRPIYYIGDFEYREGDQTICEDVKGVETAIFKMKAKLFRMHYRDIELRIVK